MNRTYDNIAFNINAKLDHQLEYAKDRNELVKELLNQNDWIVDLLSGEEFISSQVKSKKDFLNEDSKLGKTLEQIADYILFPKFDDNEHHKEYDYLKEQEKKLQDYRNELLQIKKKDDNCSELERVRGQISILHEKIKAYEKDYLSETMKRKNKIREQLEGYMDKIEEVYELAITQGGGQKNRNYKSHKIKIDEDYWDRMGFSEAGKQFRQEIIDVYEEAIEALKKQLGFHIKDKSEKEKYVENLIKKFNQNKLVFKFKDRVRVMGGEERYFKLRKMYGQLVSDYNRVKEILVEPISFQSPTPPTTVYNFNRDTWYYDEDGNIVEISQNLINFSDPNTYKGFILNYYDLADKYEDNFTDDMWYMLRLFEDVVMKADLTSEEKFIISMLMKGKTRQDIIKGFTAKFNRDISKQVLSTWITRTIPNKLTRTYIESVDDWLYTYKIKGNYKKCSKCNEIKLISNDRYFGKDSRNRDGFKSICRKCDNYTKNVDK